MSLDESLFITVAMLLTLDVLLLHDLVNLALLLPIELEVDVLSNFSDWQVLVCQFHNFLQGILVLDSLQFRVHMEVLRYNFVCNLNETFDLVAWESSCIVLLRLEDCLGDVAVLELLFLFLLFCFLSRSGFRCLYLSR